MFDEVDVVDYVVYNFDQFFVLYMFFGNKQMEGRTFFFY